jgi:hypothetical protein
MIALMRDPVSKRAPSANSSLSLFGLDANKTSLFALAILIAYAAIRDLCQAATRHSGNGGQGNDWRPHKLKQGGYTLRPVVVKPIEEHDYFQRAFLVSGTLNAD